MRSVSTDLSTRGPSPSRSILTEPAAGGADDGDFNEPTSGNTITNTTNERRSTFHLGRDDKDDAFADSNISRAATGNNNNTKMHDTINQNDMEDDSTKPTLAPKMHKRAWYYPTLKKASAVCVLLSIVLIIAGSATQSWATYSISGYQVHVGLWSTCIGDNCKLNEWKNYAICGKSADQVRDRFQSIMALGILGSFSGILTIIASAQPYKTAKWTLCRIASVFVLLGSFIAVLAVFVHTWREWYFCDGDVCAYFMSLGAKDCEWQYSHSMFMAAVAVPFAVAAMVMTLIGMYRARRIIDRDGKVIPDAPPEASSPGGATHVPSGVYAVPEGDWRFDDKSGFWWSDSNELYFSDSTGNYFDPIESAWFVPSLGEWFDAAEFDGARVSIPGN